MIITRVPLQHVIYRGVLNGDKGTGDKGTELLTHF
jgi:hypothetical protein